MLKARQCRLDAILDRYAGHSVIMLMAPPGFGKSELLSHWRRVLIASGRSVGWLQIERGWNAEIFFAKLMDMFPDLTSQPGESLEQRTQSFCAGVVARRRATNILLDDVDLLEPPDDIQPAFLTTRQ